LSEEIVVGGALDPRAQRRVIRRRSDTIAAAAAAAVAMNIEAKKQRLVLWRSEMRSHRKNRSAHSEWLLR